MRLEKPMRLLSSIIVCQLAGVVGSFFTTPAIPTWYAGLEKPFFTPPGWLIGAVWITLYTLMGVSLFIVWNRGVKESKKALHLFFLQLVLNASWSVGFFGLRSPLAGLVLIVPLWLSIVLTILEFNRLSRKAALLLLPYILWVSFAAFLNLSIFVMNV